jgi:ribosomal protein S18 acetylase RimI-like enzyme
MVRDAGGDAPERDDVSFRRATPSDGIAYERDIGTDADSTFRARLTPTTRCYLVEGEGKLLHASWVTKSRAWTAEISGSISPPPGDAYVYESFTRADARGRGIYPFALSSMCADLGAEGARRVWVGVESDNVPSIRAISKAGFTEAFELHFSRRLGRVRVKAVSGPEARVASVLLSRTEG